MVQNTTRLYTKVYILLKWIQGAASVQAKISFAFKYGEMLLILPMNLYTQTQTAMKAFVNLNPKSQMWFFKFCLWILNISVS